MHKASRPLSLAKFRIRFSCTEKERKRCPAARVNRDRNLMDLETHDRLQAPKMDFFRLYLVALSVMPKAKHPFQLASSSSS